MLFSFFFWKAKWAASRPATWLLIYAKFMLLNMEGNLSRKYIFWLIGGSASPILLMLHPFQDFDGLVPAISVYYVCVWEPVWEDRWQLHWPHTQPLETFVCSDEDTFRCHKCLLEPSEAFSLCCVCFFFLSSPKLSRFVNLVTTCMSHSCPCQCRFKLSCH